MHSPRHTVGLFVADIQILRLKKALAGRVAPADKVRPFV